MPDLNSIPSSSHGSVVAAQRTRTSSSTTNDMLHETPPQASSSLPASTVSPSSSHPVLTPSTPSSLNILPSNQSAFQEGSSGYLPSPPLPSASNMAPPLVPGQDNTGVGAGPGPLRHPRPLTAAELHSQLEQEQEMIVNRLSRDLTMLRRAQNSSVVSNTSSTSASTSAVDQLYPSSFVDSHLLSGPGFPVPTSRRHHRTSSSASSRSLSLLNNQGSSSTSTATVAGSYSGTAAVLEAARNPRGAAGMSRQNSTTSHRSSSRNRSPQPHIGSSVPLSSSYSQPHGFPEGYFNRDRASSNTSIAATPGSDLSPGLMPATLRYEETIHFRNELEVAKRENEALKKRIKALEKMIREQKESDSESSRAKSESGSTTSMSMSGITGVAGGGATGIAGARREERRGTGRAPDAPSIAVGVPKLEVRVGESAANTGAEGIPQDP